jgi:cytochrome c
MFAALMAVSLPALAAGDTGTRDEAVAMVKRVVADFHTKGPEVTFKEVSDETNKNFHDHGLYPFVYDLSGTCVAHGARPALIGKNLIDVKDPNGKYLIRDMIALAKRKDSGWITYKWSDPRDNKIEEKSSYIEKMGDYFVGVGIFKH